LSEIQTLTPEEIGQAEQMSTETLLGDVRDFFLDRLRHDRNPLPWDMRPEKEQREIIDRASAAAELLIKRVVRIVAGGGRRTVRATLEQFTVKDGAKVVLKSPASAETVVALNQCRGAEVMLVIADDTPFHGAKHKPVVKPDQSALFGDGDEGEGDAEDKAVFDQTESGKKQAAEKPEQRKRNGPRRSDSGDEAPPPV